MEMMDMSEALKLLGERVARELGFEGAEIELDYVEDEDLRLSIIKNGEQVGLLWVNPETGKIWGFTLRGNTPHASFQLQLNEFVDVMRRVL